MISIKVFKILLKKGLSIAFAESMTGGACAFEMIKNEGASKVIKGSLIAYSNEQKNMLLHIPLEEILTYGAVSNEVGMLMATKIAQIMNADIGVGITGNASLKYLSNQASQEVYIGIRIKERLYGYHEKYQGLTRLQAIKKTVKFVYQKLEENL